ncbi:MAG: hypothetical protein ACI97A_001027 [Planctomycetota bacterium]|jgi:hypothetical protein
MIRSILNLPAILGTLVLLCGASLACAQTAPSLGDARNFALLGGSTVAVAAIGTVITGEVGTYPGVSITGIPSGGTVVSPFATHSADSAAMAAQASAFGLYTELATQGGATAIAMELGGATLTPGTYSFSSTANIAAGTTLTLSGDGVYIFKVGSAITANVLSNVLLLDGAKPSNVFWQVTSAATLHGAYFAGTVVAQSSIALGVDAVLEGRAFALTAGAVTLAGNNNVGCSDINSNTTSASFSMYGFGCVSPALPALEFLPLSRPVLGTIATAVINNCPTFQVGVTLGFNSLALNPFDLAPYGLPGCMLWHTNDLIDVHRDPSVYLTPLTSTSLQIQFRVPNDYWWAGRVYYLQAYCYSPGANTYQFIVSNGVEYRLGL